WAAGSALHTHPRASLREKDLGRGSPGSGGRWHHPAASYQPVPWLPKGPITPPQGKESGWSLRARVGLSGEKQRGNQLPQAGGRKWEEGLSEEGEEKRQ
ncbi:hypothetical protein K5549_018184, partial [Capra hircus]